MDQPADRTIMSSSLKSFQSPIEYPDVSMLSLLPSDPGPGGDMENRPIQEEMGGPLAR